jgi:MFS family permease
VRIVLRAPTRRPAAWPTPSERGRRGFGRHSVAFWVVAAAFCLNLAFSAVPTPLYVIYQQRDHFSTLMITVVYAAYAVGAMVSLFLGGHVSDWVGRRRVLAPAIAVNVLSALLFIAVPSLPGLLIARVICGVSIGLTTGTATAYLAELHLLAESHPPAKPHPPAKRHCGAGGHPAGGHPAGRRPQVVATASNLGGIGVGPLGAGLLAQFVPWPLVVPYVVFGAVLVVLALLIAVAPETAARRDPRPAWRPQRVATPPHARGTFFAATAACAAAFAVYGVFNSLVPGFLAGTLHERSYAVAGAVAFAAFAAGALAQIAFGRAGTSVTLRRGTLAVFAGLALFAAGMWLPSLPVFVVGGVITGAGGGLVLRGSLAAAAATAPPQSRAEVIAGYFLGAYAGLSVTVIGLGIASEYGPARDVMLVFVALAAVAIAASNWAVVRHHNDRQGSRA